MCKLAQTMTENEQQIAVIDILKLLDSGNLTDKQKTALTRDLQKHRRDLQAALTAVECDLKQLAQPKPSWPATAAKCHLLIRMFLSVRRRYGTIATLWLGVNEFLFDRLNGTATSLEFKGWKPGPTRGGGYESSNPVLLSRWLGRLPPSSLKGTFLDYGAGKGRALLIAARYGFRRAIGVEISRELCETAAKNLRICAGKHGNCTFEIHHGDAALFEVPDDVSVVYFFNPFGQDVLLAAIHRILASLHRVPRELYIVYLNPVLGDLVIAAGFVPVQGVTGESATFRYPVGPWPPA
jgi:SAM-dependent methyltransferase